MVLDSQKIKKTTVITHSTVHGHIHTYEGYHRHIHGHIHKHQHTLPPNIDAATLITQPPKSEVLPLPELQASVIPSPSSPKISKSLEKQVEDVRTPTDVPPLGLSHCQIQQIIDQCCQHGFDNCFDCAETETIMENNGLLPSVGESMSFGDTSTALSSTTQQSDLANPVGSPLEIKSQLQSIIDFEESCIDPFCIGNETVQKGDKCFEFCDFDNFTEDVKCETNTFSELVTDVPYNATRSLNSSSKVSDIRTDLVKNMPSTKHKHIHGHDILHHCLNDVRPPEPHLCDKKRQSGKVEQFHYNWINLNDAPVKRPKLLTQLSSDSPKQKEHLHCLWTDCSSNLVKYHSNKELQSHVLQDHLMTLSSLTPDSEDDYVATNFKYECEWLDCQFRSNDVMKFLEHISMDHGFKEQLQLTAEMDNMELTNVNKRKLSTSDDHHDHSHKAVFIKTEDADDDDIDPDHTCKWELGTGTYCNQKFNSTQELTDHLIDNHIGGGHASYVCQWENCSRVHKPFNQRQKIIRHLHVHTKHRPCVCKICGKRFSFDLMVEQHMRIHTGEKPYQCSICAKWFKTSSSLSIHLRVHSGERPLICKYPGCNKRFNESSNLTKHYKIHQRRFKCHRCTKTFNLEDQLLRHLKLNHGIEDDIALEALKIQCNGFQNLEFNVVNTSAKKQDVSDESCFD